MVSENETMAPVGCRALAGVAVRLLGALLSPALRPSILKPLSSAPFVGVEELTAPQASLVFARDDFCRMQGTVVCQSPAIDYQSVREVRSSHVPDPLVILR